jgi:competence protein ComEC
MEVIPFFLGFYNLLRRANIDYAPTPQSSTHVLAISGQHVAELAAMIYLVLRLFAVPMLFHNPATLGIVWLYIFVAGAPPPSIRAGVVKTFVLAALLFGH